MTTPSPLRPAPASATSAALIAPEMALTPQAHTRRPDLPGQAPLLKYRKEIRRDEAIKLWAKKRRSGWQVCTPQWKPPSALLSR